jgi:hypothetical protein
VLLRLAPDPGARLRDIAASLGITERSAYGIVTDLTEAGYIIKQKNGRRNRHQIRAHLPLPEPKHNRHHAHPNQEDADPDIAAGALAFTAAQAHASRGAARLVYRYQACPFFPVLLGGAIGLHVASIRALRSQASRHRSWQAALLAVHVAGYLTVVFLVL